MELQRKLPYPDRGSRRRGKGTLEMIVPRRAVKKE